MDDAYLESVGKFVANSVLARDYKGLAGDNNNAILAVFYERD